MLSSRAVRGATCYNVDCMSACSRPDEQSPVSPGEEAGDAAFVCLRCGTCCARHQPEVSTAECEAIAAGLGLPLARFLSQYVEATIIGDLLRRTPAGCVFLEGADGQRAAGEPATATCKIYELRPQPCRDWAPGLWRDECRAGAASGRKTGTWK